MKTELIAKPHSQLPGVTVFEIWHNGRLIGTVTGADGPGVRVLSKYPVKSLTSTDIVTEVKLLVKE